MVLFDDNIVGAISAEDMRLFVQAIFDSKENEVHVFENLSDITIYQQTQHEYVIEKNDIIICTDHQNNNQITERGIYIALKDSPNENDVYKISADNYDTFISKGSTNMLISLDSDENLVWIEQLDGYFIEGTDTITNILSKVPLQKGPVWIASNTESQAPVPGKEGDGYSWDGTQWNNIGQLRGPEGNIQEISFATQSQVDAGVITDKSISPYTLKRTSLITKKENNLGKPQNNGQVLASDTQGQRYWIDNVRYMDDLDDVDFQNIQPDSYLHYTGTEWIPQEISQVLVKTFLTLDDTPNSYLGKKRQAVVVNNNEDGLEYKIIVSVTRDLEDWANVLPTNGDTIQFENGYWRPVHIFKSGSSSQRPLNPTKGYMFFDDNIGIPIWYNGSSWVNALGEIK